MVKIIRADTVKILYPQPYMDNLIDRFFFDRYGYKMILRVHVASLI
jgi:hypothetical protein